MDSNQININQAGHPHVSLDDKPNLSANSLADRDSVVDAAADRVSGAVSDVLEGSKGLVNRLDRQTRENPWMILGLAAGVFFVIGYLLAPKDAMRFAAEEE